MPNTCIPPLDPGHEDRLSNHRLHPLPFICSGGRRTASPCRALPGMPGNTGRPWNGGLGFGVQIKMDLIRESHGECKEYPVQPDSKCLQFSPCQYSVQWAFNKGTCTGGTVTVEGVTTNPSGTETPRSSEKAGGSDSGEWDLGLPCGWQYSGSTTVAGLSCAGGATVGGTASASVDCSTCAF